MLKPKPIYEALNNQELLALLRKHKLALGINNDLAKIGGNEAAMHLARAEAVKRLYAYESRQIKWWPTICAAVGLLGGMAGVVSLILQMATAHKR